MYIIILYYYIVQLLRSTRDEVLTTQWLIDHVVDMYTCMQAVTMGAE